FLSALASRCEPHCSKGEDHVLPCDRPAVFAHHCLHGPGGVRRHGCLAGHDVAPGPCVSQQENQPTGPGKKSDARVEWPRTTWRRLFDIGDLLPEHLLTLFLRRDTRALLL